MKKIFNLLISRVFVLSAAILLQVLLLVVVIWNFSNYFIYFYTFCACLSLLAVLIILNNNSNPAYKLAWIIPILLFPIFGGLFFLIFSKKKVHRQRRYKFNLAYSKLISFFDSSADLLEKLASVDLTAARQVRYLWDNSVFPLCQNCSAQYYSLGDHLFPALLDDLKKARHYIFLEFFIVEEGLFWDSILEVLVQKVKEGVKVRVIYDDLGSILTLPFRYERKLRALGIECQVFNPLLPFVSLKINYRDHRKIAVIDGHTAYTGGINLADEYINAYVKYGHWKDSGIRVQGSAAWSFTLMFLSTWEDLSKIPEDYKLFYPQVWPEIEPDSGYLLPYADTPVDEELVSETVYLNAINRADNFVWITTPYLILDNEMLTALGNAAKSGVDVRIITPYIADKSYVHALTRSNYSRLIQSGVKIYEYTPGFIHSKVFLVDDKIGIVGSINLDYRSLYLHFECAVWIYRMTCLQAIRQDFEQIFAVCRSISLQSCLEIPLWRRVYYSLLRIFAPLM